MVYEDYDESTTKVINAKEVEIQPQEKSLIIKRAASYTEVKTLKGHKYGIECLKFSPNSEFLISLGDPNDKGLFVWDWRNGVKLSSNRLSKPAVALAISPD